METASNSTQRIYTPRYTNEDENFWGKHISVFSDSGLSKTGYCKKNAINYARFFYWIKKLSPSKVQQVKNKACVDNPLKKAMLPVQLKKESEKIKSNVLCTLSLKNGCVLHIHDQEALCLMLEKWN